MLHKKESGFTLIELLVVIAIIGILSSVVLASLNSARKKGRDARRVADIKQLQLALELHYDATGAYPSNISTSTLVGPGYIASLPGDPSNGVAYSYTPYAASGSTASCTGYHLGTDLETSGHSSLSGDSDVFVGGTPNAGETDPGNLVVCTASGSPTNDFHGADAGKCNAANTGVTCYDVRS